MSTVLTQYSDNGNTRTYTYTGHTALDPHIVIQKRKVASGAASVIEDIITVLSGTEDVDGRPLQSRVTFQATIRRPVSGQAADVTAVMAVFRDIIAGDQFATTVNTQNWLS